LSKPLTVTFPLKVLTPFTSNVVDGLAVLIPTPLVAFMIKVFAMFAVTAGPSDHKKVLLALTVAFLPAAKA